MAGDVNTFELGNLVRLSCEFSDTATGALVDPTTVTFRIRTPAGSVIEHTYPDIVQKSAQGKYYVDWPVALPGRYTYRFFSTGIGMASRDKVFVVQPAGV
jgi:hypothetical protein